MRDQQPTPRETRPRSSSTTGQRFPRPTARLAHAHDTALYGCHRTADDWGFALIGESYVDQPWRRAARACGLPAEQVEDPRSQTLDGLGGHTAETHGLSVDEPGLVSDPGPAAHRTRLLLAVGGLA